MTVKMTHNGWQRPLIRALTTGMTLTVMAVIFFFSTENADLSNQTGDGPAQWLLRIISPDYERLPPEEQQTRYDQAQMIVRKAAHFSEYAMLGLSLRLCLESWLGHRRKRLWPAAWACGALYSCTDELHQMLVDGRTGQLLDVVIDSAGVLFGAVLGGLLLAHVFRLEQARPAAGGTDERGGA